MMKHLLFIIIIVGGGYYFWTTRPVTHGPGVMAPDKPVQTQAFGQNSFEHNNYTITPLAKFEMEVRVLSKKRYYSDTQSEIAPYDFVVGWGPMSDTRNLDHILIKQSDRFFYWEMIQPPIPREEMWKHSANMHLLPSNEIIMEKLSKVREGHIIELKGYLVKVKSEKGWILKSSLSRNDKGKSSSEVVWIEDFKIF